MYKYNFSLWNFRRELRSQLCGTLVHQLRTRYVPGAGHSSGRGISGDYSNFSQSQFALPQHASVVALDSDDHVDAALSQRARVDYLKAIGVLLRCLQRPAEYLNIARYERNLSLDSLQLVDFSHNIQIQHPPTIFSILVRYTLNRIAKRNLHFILYNFFISKISFVNLYCVCRIRALWRSPIGWHLRRSIWRTSRSLIMCTQRTHRSTNAATCDSYC